MVYRKLCLMNKRVLYFIHLYLGGLFHLWLCLHLWSSRSNSGDISMPPDNLSDAVLNQLTEYIFLLMSCQQLKMSTSNKIQVVGWTLSK